MTNVLHSVLRKVIFQELGVANGHIIQFILFVCAFNAFEFIVFYNHRNREGDVIIIPSTMGIRQGDPFGGALFVLTHLKALHL
jgi:hypothetical protein